MPSLVTALHEYLHAVQVEAVGILGESHVEGDIDVP